MAKIHKYAFPSTVSEAAKTLAKMKDGAVILAGGTNLIRSIPPETECVVDLRNLPLRYMKEGTRALAIGACTTFEDLLASQPAKKWAGGILHKAAKAVSTKMVRVMGTVGGNIVRHYPYNHLPPVLIALDATATIVDGGKKKDHPVSDILEGDMARKLGKTALLTEIKIPSYARGMNTAFVKLAKAGSMWECSAIVCVALEVKGGVCKRAAISAGSALPRAKRFPAAEQILVGNKITPELAARAGEAAMEGLTGFTSIQSSPEYKREVLPVLIRRAILEACGGAAI